MAAKKAPKWERRNRICEPSDPEKKFRLQATAMADVALHNSILWIARKEIRWVLSEAQRAVKLLEVAR